MDLRGEVASLLCKNVPCGDICTKDYYASFMFCGTFKVKCPVTLDIIVQLFEDCCFCIVCLFLSFYSPVLMYYFCYNPVRYI